MNTFFITPIAGAIIGYVTNWIAIRMLFRPHTAKYVFGIKLPFTPGLMPKERHRISRKIGETLAEHLVTTDMITTYMLSDESMSAIERELEKYLQDTKVPAAGMIAKVVNSLLKSEKVKAGLAQAIGGAVSNIDLGKMAEEQMNAMDIAEAERIIISVVRRELQVITMLGGVLGFVIGLVQGVMQLL